MALWPKWYSQAANTQRVAAEPQNRPMMVADDHGCVCPPHSMASRNIVVAGANMTNPTKSRCFMRDGSDMGIDFLFGDSGMLIRVRIKRVTEPRMGLM